MSGLPVFEKLKNIRDLGGMESSDGRKVRYGKLIRSSHLADLTAAEAERLSELVGVIVDFRTVGECRQKPDVVPASVRYIHLPVVDSLKPGITREEESDFQAIMHLAKDPEGARQYMCGMYRSFADSETAVRQYEAFVRLLLEDREKAVLWHCTAGKDRAGVACVIVGEILRIPREAIVRDYLKTNEYLKGEVAFLTEYIKSQVKSDSALNEESIQYLFGARQEYIETYYEQIRKNYGGFHRFLADALHLSSQDMETFQQIYLRQ